MNNIPIELSRGYVAYISPEDVELVAVKWSAHVVPQRNRLSVRAFRALRGDNKHKEYLSRAVLERKLNRPLQPGEQARMIDGDTLNCTRENIELRSISFK